MPVIGSTDRLPSLHTLLPHPASPCAAVSAINVALYGTRATALELRYRVSGPQAEDCLRNAVAGGRSDGLWAHTCCELFVGAAESPAYREFNFSPHGAWAAYDFSDYRAGMRPAAAVDEPQLQLRRGEGDWTLVVSVAGHDLLPAGQSAQLRLGLCTVIEQPDAALAYWALRHPTARPDFHHRDAFVIEWP
jgi:hypothetical protein